MGRFILTKECLLGQDLVVEVAMLLLHCGQQISLMVLLQLRRNSKNGQVRLVPMFPSFSPREQPIVLVEARYVFVLQKFILQFRDQLFFISYSYKVLLALFVLKSIVDRGLAVLP